MTTPKAPRGRGRPAGSRAGDPGTRERILGAARTLFAERGYDKASIRAIAQAAGVDAALVHHYFGAKEQVFEAAVEVSFAPALGATEALTEGTVDRSEAGERLARYFLDVWENPATRAPLLAVLRSAVTNETAATVLRGFVLRRLLSRVVGELDQPDAALRAQLAASQMIGLAVTRYVLKIEPIASVPTEELVARIAPTLQRHLTGA
ncbi:TetR family transcriptional regulator [Streptomyces sp. SL13]|uniref:TetR family transcriptional regulator n=1 Tax=Streptantibioticus silvisoli TaxID=2705255 RepID=A0AA90H2B7_9ACTN|nr:TetR family transcriptional regulator [Streptantibioticus silvisoli]MDI5962840.1 TetR family transcriptional regulator [Streptantibioticus silvisoli]MDI5969668.1 TetR family transcriptional regulator [Streptantibioticus silvisoli]